MPEAKRRDTINGFLPRPAPQLEFVPFMETSEVTERLATVFWTATGDDRPSAIVIYAYRQTIDSQIVSELFMPFASPISAQRAIGRSAGSLYMPSVPAPSLRSVPMGRVFFRASVPNYADLIAYRLLGNAALYIAGNQVVVDPVFMPHSMPVAFAAAHGGDADRLAGYFSGGSRLLPPTLVGGGDLS